MTARGADAAAGRFPGNWVRIMADALADGVWDRDGCGDRADALPVPADLVARIRAWQAWYDRDGWGDDAGRPLARFDLDAFAAEGLAIAQAVKAALPDWTVIYFDEAAAERDGWSGGDYQLEVSVPATPLTRGRL
jgi:hypothetical protein